MTHPTWELFLNKKSTNKNNVNTNEVNQGSVNGSALVLTPCPGTKGVDLQESLLQLKAQGVTTVVTALSIEEMQASHVETLGEQVKALGMQWLHLPIEDDQAPNSEFAAQWAVASPILHQAIQHQQKIAMHCMGGSGRTGLLAANLLLELDWRLPEIVMQVQALRPGAFTKPIQIAYVNELAQGFAS